MRKIESDIVDALRAKRSKKFDNTEVLVSDAGNIQIILHGSPVVRIENNAKDIFISLAGFNTQTTRSRINAAMDFYGISRVGNVKRVPMLDGYEVPARGWLQVRRNGVSVQPENK
jgi:hypothetical protein